MEHGKERFFKNGKFEIRDSPLDPNCRSYDDGLESAGYEKLGAFGPGGNGYGFGLTIDRCKDGERHVVTIDYGDTFDLIFIETFADYMEFMRQFGHLGTLAETAHTSFYVKDAYEFALDTQFGILREQVREGLKAKDTIEKRLRSRPSSAENSESKR